MLSGLPDPKAVGAIYLLPQLLPLPPSRSKKAEVYWKPSRSEVQEGFITIVKGSSQVSEVVQNKKLKYLTIRRALQPYIILVGGDIFNVEEAYIIVDDTKYRANSFLEAFDVCFKIFFSTGARYPEECEDVWTFIERAFFKICSKDEKNKPKHVSQAVKHLLTNLQLPCIFTV